MSGPNNTTCAICGSLTRVIGSKRGVRALRCPSCGFVAKDMKNLPSDYWKTWKLASKESFDFRNKGDIFEFRLRTLISYFGDGLKKILDFGCGSGEFVHFLRKKGYDAYGCDTGAKTPDEDFFFKGDIKDLPARDFDVITSIETFEHLIDPCSVMKELSARLRKGGILYLQTHYSHIATVFGWRYFNFAGHISFYPPGAMKTLMENSSIELIYYDKKRQPFFLFGFLYRNLVHIWCRFAPYLVKEVVLKLFDRPIFSRYESSSTNKSYVDKILLVANCLYIGRKK